MDQENSPVIDINKSKSDSSLPETSRIEYHALAKISQCLDLIF